MEESPWLRIITIGLVLAALAVGYFLISGRFFAKSPRSEAPVERAVQQSTTPTPRTQPPAPTPTASPTPQTIQGGVQTLPRTGSLTLLLAVVAVSAMISGWGLRKFPH